MADLTVLSSLSPIPTYPSLSRPSFYSYNARASSSKVHLPGSEKIRPKLPQIQVDDGRKDRDEENEDSDDSETPTASSSRHPIASSFGGSQTSSLSHSTKSCDSSQQHSPFPNIISPIPRVGNRPTHRPTRSQSAPPERIYFTPADSLAPSFLTDVGTSCASSSGAAEQFPASVKNRQKRGYSTFNSPSTPWGYSSQSNGPGDLVRPLPPLHRPTTFWRRTPRSGVTSSSYSPSTHLIRRSTFIAAGLTFDKPIYDVSAQGVESRIVNDAVSGKVTGSFWEVIV